MDGIFTTLDKAKELLPKKYLWMQTDKCKTRDEYENLLTGEVKFMDPSFGPDEFIEEIEADKKFHDTQ